MTKGWEISGVECPECGGLKTEVAKAGYDFNGLRIRDRRCRDCWKHFGTAEVPLPENFSFSATDIRKSEKDHDKYQRMVGRRVPRAVSRRSSDYLEVEVRIIRGRRSDYCRKGLHKIVGDNAYIQPSTGHRSCKECRRAQHRAWVNLNRKYVNLKRNEHDRQKRRERREQQEKVAA